MALTQIAVGSAQEQELEVVDVAVAVAGGAGDDVEQDAVVVVDAAAASYIASCGPADCSKELAAAYTAAAERALRKPASQIEPSFAALELEVLWQAAEQAAVEAAEVVDFVTDLAAD